MQCYPTDNRCLNPRWLDEVRMDDGDEMGDDYDYALIDDQAQEAFRASDSTPIEFHSRILFKIARKCPSLKTLSLVQCLMGHIEEDGEDDEDDEEENGGAGVSNSREVRRGDSDQGCQMAKFDPFLSLDCARVEGVGRNPMKGRDQILQRSVAKP